MINGINNYEELLEYIQNGKQEEIYEFIKTLQSKIIEIQKTSYKNTQELVMLKKENIELKTTLEIIKTITNYM